MNNEFDILNKIRILILNVIDGLTIEQLNKIPQGFGNNIAWNVAHLTVTQQLLCYKLSGLDMLVSDEMVNLYRKGTAPQKNVSSEEFEEIKRKFLELPNQFENDFKKGIFKNYNEYTTSPNITLTSIEKATAFNNCHEGMHLGSILALRKLV